MVLDSQRRIIAVLGGQPNDDGWKTVVDGAARFMDERLHRVSITEAGMHHRRAQGGAEEGYAPISRGWSHGGGQLRPGELQNSAANQELTDELLAERYYQCLAGFANSE